MKVKFFLFAASIAALSLAGCAKDENEMQGNPDNPIVAEGAGTMNISLKYAVGTRANGDYEDGTESESKVRDLTVYFFDKDEKYLGKGEAPKLTELPGDGHNIERNVIAVEVPAEVVSSFYGNEDPMTEAYVVAVLNKGKFAPTLTKETSTYDDFNAVISSMAITDITEADNFLMTSSNYVDANGKEQALVKITKENVGVKSNSVSKEPEKVEIAVERVAAKVKVLTGANVEILGWGLNVTNNKFFPVKKFTTGFLDVLDTRYGDWEQKTTWSNLTDKRSHWAVDPNYTSGIVEMDGTSTEFALLDYAGLIDAGKSAYCFENTFNEAMQNRNATTTAIIVAKFNPAGTDNGMEGTWVNWKQQNFSDADFVNTVVADADGKDHNITKYYYRVVNPDAGEDFGNGYEVGDYIYYPLGTANFEFSCGENSEDIMFGEKVIGKKNITANVVLKSDITGDLYTLPAKTDDNEEWEKSKVENARTAIADAITAAIDAANNPVTVYIGGYCYYEVPLRHFNDSEVAEFEGGGGAYEPKHLGRYGIVRNNDYVLTVKAINTPGKPITGKPIPTTEKDDYESYYIDVDIQVLSWNIRNQEVEL